MLHIHSRKLLLRPFISSDILSISRAMSNAPTNRPSHEERTAAEPRQNALHQVILSKIQQVNPTIRLLELEAVEKGESILVRVPRFSFLPSPFPPQCV